MSSNKSDSGSGGSNMYGCTSPIKLLGVGRQEIPKNDNRIHGPNLSEYSGYLFNVHDGFRNV